MDILAVELKILKTNAQIRLIAVKILRYFPQNLISSDFVTISRICQTIAIIHVSGLGDENIELGMIISFPDVG